MEPLTFATESSRSLSQRDALGNGCIGRPAVGKSHTIEV